MAKRKGSKGTKAKTGAKPADKPAQEVPAVKKDEEEKTDYVSPEFMTKDGAVAKAVAAAEKELGTGGPEITKQFEKADKAGFGYSVEGKKDFCRHQIALYLARLAELIAEDSPEQKSAKKLARLKSAQEKRQKEIDELEKAAK